MNLFMFVCHEEIVKVGDSLKSGHENDPGIRKLTVC